MPDVLFGIEVPENIPAEEPEEVFPHDPDFNFRRRRQWETIILPLSPLLEQRIIRNSEPLIQWEIGLSAMRGPFDTPKPEFEEDLPIELITGCENDKFELLWVFFNNHRARQLPFWFYDPVPWSRFPKADPTDINFPMNDYRDYPPARIQHPTTPELGRYIVHFDEDEMEVDLFEHKLRKASLKLVGYPG